MVQGITYELTGCSTDVHNMEEFDLQFFQYEV